MRVKVASKRVEAVDICTFELESLDASPLPAFAAGAHIDVLLGPSLTRQYSLCTARPRGHRYLIGVLRDPGSRGGSLFMHDRVNEGDVLTISQPRNHFPLHREAQRSLLFAGGIGVTPILCMAERLAETGGDFVMHYCSRSQERTAFRDHIARQTWADRVKFHFDDQAVEQRLDAAAILSTPSNGTHLYVCGPTGFMKWILDTATRAGWPEAQVHREYFGAAPVGTHADGSFNVKIASSGRIICIPAAEPVTVALARHDIDIPVSCEQGVCGTCVTRVLQGEPEHRDLYFTDAEKELNDQFTPCCSRARSDLLVLDL